MIFPLVCPLQSISTLPHYLKPKVGAYGPYGDTHIRLSPTHLRGGLSPSPHVPEKKLFLLVCCCIRQSAANEYV